MKRLSIVLLSIIFFQSHAFSNILSFFLFDVNGNMIIKVVNCYVPSTTGEDSIINMEAEESLYINNVSETENLNIGTIKAGEIAAISSEIRDILAYDEDSYISAKNIELNAKKGNIGSANNKLKLTGFELLSGYAKENIDIEIFDFDVIANPEERGNPVYNIGGLKSEEGYIDIYSGDSGINLKGEIDAKESINADVYGNITDDAGNNTSGFYAKNINLVSRKGSIGSKENSIRIGASPSSVIPGGSSRESILNAESETGIYAESEYTVIVDKVETKTDAKLESENDIKAKKQEDGTSNIKAENIELTASGNIGEEDNRIVTEITKEKGKTNLKANGNILLKQNGMNRFYSDYVINKGNGNTSLLLPDNHAFIIDLDVANPGLFKIDFAERKYKNNVSIGHNAIEKLAIHPVKGT